MSNPAGAQRLHEVGAPPIDTSDGPCATSSATIATADDTGSSPRAPRRARTPGAARQAASLAGWRPEPMPISSEDNKPSRARTDLLGSADRVEAGANVPRRTRYHRGRVSSASRPRTVGLDCSGASWGDRDGGTGWWGKVRFRSEVMVAVRSACLTRCSHESMAALSWEAEERM